MLFGSALRHICGFADLAGVALALLGVLQLRVGCSEARHGVVVRFSSLDTLHNSTITTRARTLRCRMLPQKHSLVSDEMRQLVEELALLQAFM